MWRRVMMPRAGATDEQAAFLSRETKSARREGKKNARLRAASSLPPRPKSDLKSSYVDFDPHCASALDFGTIITFRERRRRRRSGGGEKKKDQKRAGRFSARGKKKEAEASLFAFRFSSLRFVAYPRIRFPPWGRPRARRTGTGPGSSTPGSSGTASGRTRARFRPTTRSVTRGPWAKTQQRKPARRVRRTSRSTTPLWPTTP